MSNIYFQFIIVYDVVISLLISLPFLCELFIFFLTPSVVRGRVINVTVVH